MKIAKIRLCVPYFDYYSLSIYTITKHDMFSQFVNQGGFAI
jgi:hypothetical protein